MFIPRYWSEASHREPLAGRDHVTVRRFGWSSSSQEEADAHARQRVEGAVATLREGGPDALEAFTRRERAIAYAGADGLPIREEVLAEHPALDVVVTRNGYGAACLNTTRAMFVDVDAQASNVGLAGCVGALAGFVVGLLAGPLLLGWSVWAGGVAGLVAVGALTTAARAIVARRDLHVRDTLAWAVARTHAWCEAHPDWRVAVYETPAGARLLPVHAPFDAGDDASFEFMRFVEADARYQRMCRLQRCFRARVSPKPWRAGVAEHFRAGGTWPVRDPAKLAVRSAWVRRYEAAAKAFASCRWVETVGTGRSDARVEAVRRLHDELCRATSGLTTA
ncbi:MAG: hypothetical protein JNM10_15545 [Planctomycetia bacterium]|nr:hypothetical protein [Planctomycetia bacterium]